MHNKISAVALACLLCSPAWADDDKDEEGYWSHVKTDWLRLEDGAKPFYFRAGYTLLSPNSSSSEVVLTDVEGPASLAISSGPIAGSGASIEDSQFPSVIVGYQFGSGRWAMETILALPFTMKFKATGTLASESIAPYANGNIPTGVPALGSEFGETKVLPPVVTLVYRFRLDKAFRPYVGAGPAYLYAYDSKVTNSVLTEVSQPGLEVDNAFGSALQTGIEYNFHSDWWVNFDVKYIGLKTSATVTNMYVNTPALETYEVAKVGDATIDVTADPWVYQLGVGFNF